VIQRYTARFKKWCISKKDLSNRDKLKEFFSLYEYLSDHGKKICPVGMLTAEYPTLPDNIKKDVQIILDEEKK
jgi:hypothetical protein